MVQATITDVLKVINMARTIAPTWELYSFDNQVLGNHFNAATDDYDLDSLRNFPLNGNYICTWWVSKDAALDWETLMAKEAYEGTEVGFFVNIHFEDVENTNEPWCVITQLSLDV